MFALCVFLSLGLASSVVFLEGHSVWLYRLCAPHSLGLWDHACMCVCTGSLHVSVLVANVPGFAAFCPWP